MKNGNNIISDWLAKNGNPEIGRMVRHNLAISTKISRILEEKQIGKKEFANKMSKSPSEISKWLSGTHNFTIKTIAKVEEALDEKIIYTEKEYQYVHFHISKTPQPKNSTDYEFMSGYAS